MVHRISSWNNVSPLVFLQVSLWTQQTVSQMVNQSIALLFQSHQPHTGGSVSMSNGQSSAVVDLYFLLRLLPMVTHLTLEKAVPVCIQYS